MKVVHIITRLILGGAQENTILSCEGQHDRGHEVTLITGPAIGPEGSLLERAKSYGYRVIVDDEMRRAINPLRDRKTYQGLKQLIAELKPDVVHTHSSKAGIIGRWAAHRAEAKFIVHTIHGLAFTASKSAIANGAYKWLERTTAPITDRIVCVADAMREQSLSARIGQRDQYVTVYSGMETKPFLDATMQREDIRRSLPLRADDIVVGTIARLFELKGHDDLLAIAPTLKNPHVKFLWIGDGLLRGQFESRIATMGLQDRFILTGLVPTEKIPSLTSAMDILVHPSRREGLARALPQAALAGKPVIAYDIDGNREALIEGESGFAVVPFDKSQLAAKIELLASDASLRDKMGARGREFALARFDIKVMIDALERVYQQRN